MLWNVQVQLKPTGRQSFRTTQGTATGLKSVVAPHFNRLSSTSRPPPKTLITASISSLGWPTIRHTICKLKSFLAKWDDTRNKKQYKMECTEANKSYTLTYRVLRRENVSACIFQYRREIHTHAFVLIKYRGTKIMRPTGGWVREQCLSAHARTFTKHEAGITEKISQPS